MKRLLIAFAIALATVSSANAQYDMGDTELNASLNTIISKAKIQFSEFKTYITQNYNVGRDKYDMWQNTIGMNAGDIYLAVEIAKVSRKSVDDVTASFKKNKSQGWAAIAKEFGVSPGTDAFDVLKGHAYYKANGKPRPVVKKNPKAKAAPKTPSKTTKPKTKPKKE